MAVRTTPIGTKPKTQKRRARVIHAPRRVSLADLPFKMGGEHIARGCQCGWLTASPDKKVADEALKTHLKEARS